MRKIYRFTVDCGRMGELNGIFSAEEKEVKNLIGQYVDFGEALGKHSEISGEIEEDEIEEITDDQEFVKKFDELNAATGYNPFDYIYDYD